jgi:hypothetical protein
VVFEIFCVDVPEEPPNREFSQKAAKITKVSPSLLTKPAQSSGLPSIPKGL